MIQDVIDEYNREWKDFLLTIGEGPKVDAEGFIHKYVNKDAIIQMDQLTP